MKTLRAELHLHTVLSPCAAVEMIPPLIVQTALERGIDLIAVTDHNAIANVPAVMEAAEGSGLVVLPGMELQTREEVHVLCLFDDLTTAQQFQTVVDAHYPDITNDPDHIGEQFVVDASGGYLCSEERMLSASSTLTLREAWREVSALGGLFIPAHVDRPMYGLIVTLGFVPPDLPFEALEISRRYPPEEACRLFPEIGRYPLVQGGDVHNLVDFLGVNELTVEQPSLAELRLALQGQQDRKWTLLPLPS